MEIGKLGFGLMRLPKNGEEIDIEQTKTMVDMFMEAGFNYFDTAWAYAGSEDAIRQALVERYPRESFILATKNAAWIKCKTREEAIDQFTTSLRQTGAGYIDYYLLHNLGEGRTKVFEDFDLWNWAFEMKAQGKIKHVGFSFHSTADELDEILNNHPEAEFVQLQINYADWDDPAVQSRLCYEVARKHNKPIIVMEPIKGGMLAKPPETVARVFKEADKNASVASWAMRFAADLDGVITVLSGMSSIEQMQDNISYMKGFNGLSDTERAVIEKAREELNKIPLIPCTTCNYCAKVCPVKIGISGSFGALNLITLYKDEAFARNKYNWQVINQGFNPPGDCIKCGQCEEACPQHIAIRDELEKADKAFG